MFLFKAIICSLLISTSLAFSVSTTATNHKLQNKRISSTLPRHSSSSQDATSTSTTELTTNPDAKPSDEWELDCYSRPVMVGGKKLWEVLITDSNGSFRLCETLPSNK